jgi:hypothetical protein
MMFERVALAKSSSVSCLLASAVILACLPQKQTSVKLDELLAYYYSRDYKVLVGEFSYACYRKWHLYTSFL